MGDNPVAIWAWLVRGLGGLVNLMMALQQEGVKINGEWSTRLRNEVERLRAVAEWLEREGKR